MQIYTSLSTDMNSTSYAFTTILSGISEQQESFGVLKKHAVIIISKYHIWIAYEKLLVK